MSQSPPDLTLATRHLADRQQREWGQVQDGGWWRRTHAHLLTPRLHRSQESSQGFTLAGQIGRQERRSVLQFMHTELPNWSFVPKFFVHPLPK